MEYSEGEIGVPDIDQAGDAFRITTAPLDEALLHSIGRIGLLNRPLLIPRKGRFTVVCGFRRIAALKTLGRKRIHARLLPEETPDRRCLEIAIADNGSQRLLNVIEMARAVHGLSLFCGPEERDTAISAALNLGPNAGMLKKLRAIHTLPEWMKNAILNGRLDFAVASEISAFDHGDLRAMTVYFNTLNLSLSKQREFVTLVTEISKREAISVQGILDEPALKAILDDPEMEGNQKGGKIRSFLKKRRYPILVQAEERYAGLVRNLKLAPDTSLSPPKDFEGSTFSLTLRFNSIEALAEKRRDVDRLIENPVFEEVINKRFY